MYRLKPLLTALLSAVLASSVQVHGVAAATPQAYASGVIRTPRATVEIAAALDSSRPPYFELWDYSESSPRRIVLSEVSEVSCLGELFGGQAIGLTGRGWDSLSNEGGLELQVYLVDGGGGPDRASVKLRRADDRVVYFLPMRDLASGDVSVSCAP